MNDIHPAIQLLNLSALIMFWLVPISAWWMLKGLQDHKSRLWYLGAGCYALTATIYALSSGQGLFSLAAVFFLSILSVLFLIEALRLETNPRNSILRPQWILIAVALPCALLTAIYLADKDLARALDLVYLSALESWLITIVFRVKRIWSSRSLDIILLVFAMYIAVNMARVVHWIHTGEMPTLYDFTLLGNVTVIINIISVIFYSFGYWGFALEKSQRQVEEGVLRLIEAKAREQDAEYRSTLAREREDFVSRMFKFSRLAQAGTLSASIAHEINQPLTSVRLNLDLAILELSKEPKIGRVRDILERARGETICASAIILRIRKLFQKSSLQLEPRLLDDVIERLLDTLCHGENFKDLVIEKSLHAPTPLPIAQGEFEHALTNLFDNAAKSLSASSNQPKTIAVTTYQDNQFTYIEITDNGIGIPAELRDTLFDLAISNKTDGMGMGLWLTRYIIERHLGSISVFDISTGGAGFRIKLSMRDSKELIDRQR